MSVLVGLCSTYLEGELSRGAVRSLLEACERVYVFEGPAGKPLEDAGLIPPTNLTPFMRDMRGDYPRLVYHSNRWRTDARKRQAMLERAKQDYPDKAIWGVIVDGDEVLMNGAYLRDWLLRLDYHEQLDPDAEYLGRPMRIVELDGSVAWVRGRLLRLDRIIEYKVSTSVFQTTQGLYTNAGNTPDLYSDWERPRTPHIKQDRMMMMPPLPTEPYLVHRSMLRHPLRSGLRMHEQERDELRAAGMKVEP